VTAHTDEQFIQAENNWDLERLYNDLTVVKGKNITRIEEEEPEVLDTTDDLLPGNVFQ